MIAIVAFPPTTNDSQSWSIWLQARPQEHSPGFQQQQSTEEKQKKGYSLTFFPSNILDSEQGNQKNRTLKISHFSYWRHDFWNLIQLQNIGALKMHYLWSVFSAVIFAAIGKQLVRVWGYTNVAFSDFPPWKTDLGRALCKQSCKQIGHGRDRDK